MDTIDELERLLAEADLDTLSVETVPTSIGCCHQIMPIEACLYANGDRIVIDENNLNLRRRLARAKVLALGTNALPALLAVARAAERSALSMHHFDTCTFILTKSRAPCDCGHEWVCAALARLRGAE